MIESRSEVIIPAPSEPLLTRYRDADGQDHFGAHGDFVGPIPADIPHRPVLEAMLRNSASLDDARRRDRYLYEEFDFDFERDIARALAVPGGPDAFGEKDFFFECSEPV